MARRSLSSIHCAPPGHSVHLGQTARRDAEFVAGHRGLMMTLIVLRKGMAAENLRLIMTAARADKTVRPTMTFQFFEADVLGGGEK